MVAVIQRVTSASVSIAGSVKSQISKGLLVLLGIEDADDQSDIDWLTRKIANLRIFADEQDVMNNSLLDCNGEVLVVSQFTLQASTKKGNRPSYIKAAKPDIAIPLYESFVETIQKEVTTEIRTGEFGADMQISLINDGPVTIVIDTKNKQ
ncbi:MAG: D-aminoacyl-tRNA deacylase [Cyclobacteriaceae bacterium]